MNIVCKVCKVSKPEKEFRHKYYAPTMCLECRKKKRDNYNRKNPRLNETKWMDIIIGRN